MKSSLRSFLALALCASSLAFGIAGCDLFTQLTGQTADVPIIDQGSIRLVTQNESGLNVDVDATFTVGGVPVRETRLALTPIGPESIKSILRTTAERIDVIARVGAPGAGGNSALTIGTILLKASYVLDVDYVAGGTIYFIVPAPDPAGNPNPICADLGPPTITCPPNVTLPCGSSVVPGLNPALTVAAGVDDCDDEVNVSSSDEVQGDSCSKLIVRTWRVTDNLGKSSFCQQGIVLVDETGPVLTIPADAVVECGDDLSPAATGELIASDGCNDLLQAPTYFDHEPIGDCPKTILRTWTAMDVCGNSTNANQLITVVDTLAPTVDDCPTGDVLTAESGCSISAPDYTGLVSASDACGPGAEASALQLVVTQSPVPGAPLPLGETEIVFTVADACQNTTTCSMYVTVTTGDADEDGVPDCADQCPGYDDTIDCNNNGMPDACEILACDGDPACSDCNENGVPDGCDLAACVGDPACGDCDQNGVPDGCEYYLADCNANALADECEIAHGLAHDLNDNDSPDECDLNGDIDGDGVLNAQDIVAFITCLLQGNAQGPCALADLDGDNDVDFDDLFLFILLFLDP
ncbi:hypothetical protein RAS2_35140 [Phycisphaerae bacterium RAS2]|nr:hypothetical protein RAS2_35140 [Phycisphaerae bacterium RAS2]